MTDPTEQVASKCYLLFGNPHAPRNCTSACRDTAVRPFSNEIVPVYYCPEHAHLWANPDGSAHDASVLKLAERHFGANCDEGPPPCHANCRAISLSHELAGRGLWRPPSTCAVWCPTHSYLHVCRGCETPCNACYTCSVGTWCVFRCRGERYANKGVPCCPWSGRELSNIDAPLTKAPKLPGSVRESRIPSTPDTARRKTPNMNAAYIRDWLKCWRTAHEPNVPPLPRAFTDIEDIVGSWGAVSADWPASLHVAGWVYLLSSLNRNRTTLPLKAIAERMPLIDALAATQFRKGRASNAADAIVCHMMTHSIPAHVLEQLQRDCGLFSTSAVNKPPPAIRKRPRSRAKNETAPRT